MSDIRKTKSLRNQIRTLVLGLFFSSNVLSQVDSTVHLIFDFNDHELRENDNKINIKPVGVVLSDDRFGNKNSAAFLMGDNNSYLNLGTSKLLKSPNISISLWVNLTNRVYTGKGYDYNPILITKNGPGTDFINALNISYDVYIRRLSINSTKDSTQEVILTDNDPIEFNKWYHLVLICNNNYMAFYVDGHLKGKSPKNFETTFLETDSMVIGHSANKKNARFMRGMIDDIHIFHRSLSEKEVLDLYRDEDPNEKKRLLNEVLKYGIIILVLILIIILLIIRNKRALKKQKEQLELVNKISQLELRAVKAQMNPHFISNCLVAIQDLIYSHNIENAGLYIAKFSYFLRQVLNYSDENYISLAEEIEMVKLYVELEQLRFKDKFRFDLNIDTAIDQQETMVPSLITQPFIENAIWHGLLPLKNMSNANLKVSALKKDGVVVLAIEDNGVGRNLEKMTSSKSKGTQLVMDKIESLNRLAGTQNYKIEIQDLIDEKKQKLGTKVIIYLTL